MLRIVSLTVLLTLSGCGFETKSTDFTEIQSIKALTEEPFAFGCSIDYGRSGTIRDEPEVSFTVSENDIERLFLGTGVSANLCAPQDAEWTPFCDVDDTFVRFGFRAIGTCAGNGDKSSTQINRLTGEYVTIQYECMEDGTLEEDYRYRGKCWASERRF